jgi:hypothetical protein
MDELYVEIVKVVLLVVNVAMVYFLIPFLRRKSEQLKNNMDADQRKNLMFWTTLAVKIAESIYTEKGQGLVKREYVIDFLNKNGVKFTEEQLDFLIESVVDLYNEKGWGKDIVEIIDDFSK